jgi:hypothetical protein
VTRQSREKVFITTELVLITMSFLFGKSKGTSTEFKASVRHNFLLPSI